MPVKERKWLLLQIETKLPEAIFTPDSQDAQPSVGQEPLALELCATGYKTIAVPLQLPTIVSQGDAKDDSTLQGAGVPLDIAAVVSTVICM